MVGCFFFCLTAFLTISLAVYFTTDHQTVETSATQVEFQENAEVLHLGDFSICAWETVPVADTVMVNGEEMTFTTPVIQGETCDTGELVILVFGTNGVHGSIGSTQVTAESENVSRLEEDDLEGDLPSLDEETPKTEARAKQWLHDKVKLVAASQGRRQLLSPGLVDVHLHLDLDKHMTDTLGKYGAAEYAVELVAIINRDVYYPLGFNLKVVSINLRESYVSQSTSTSAYLDVIQAEGLPATGNVNLVHSLSTRSLGGGIAYLGGLYSPQYYGYGVSGSLRGNFNKWDLVVVAHELGHNFGAEHTHEMTPQVDTCGNSCPADASGATIMSYCHLCSGGLNNIDFVFHPEVKEDILGAYTARNAYMADRRDCTAFSTDLPDIGVPFYLKTDQCVNMAGDNPILCELGSAWVREAQTGPFQLIALTDRGLCWKANCETKTVALTACSDNDNTQQFEFQGSELRSVACASPVTSSTGDDAVLTLKANGVALTQWCSPDEPVPTMAPTEPIPCDNSNNGATDPYGDDCAWYDANPNGCGMYDDSDFKSNEMCCTCGGGVNPTQPTTQAPLTQEPTGEPTAEPTSEPTFEPTQATPEPTASEPTTPHPFSPTPPATQPPSFEPTAATAEPTASTSEPTFDPTSDPTQQPGQCENSNDGTTDPWGDDCSWYEANPTGCGKYNDNDFFSEEMCCVCGGGRGDGVPTPQPTANPTPSPTTPPAGEDRCYIRECGCAPFLKSWCNADAHRLVNWCGQSKNNCQACNGSWCPGGPATTRSPTTAPPTTVPTAPVTDSPTSAAPTLVPTLSPTEDLSTDSPTTTPTEDLSTDSPTKLPTEDVSTDSPTTRPTTGSPTQVPSTDSPTTANPTTADPTEVTSTTFETSTTESTSYVEADVPEGKTCKNSGRIAAHCRGQNACSQSFCQQLCDDTDACMFYFFNEKGRCHLFSECTKFRRPGNPGVTMQKLLEDPTSTTVISTSGAPWEQGVKLTHFWDCNGMACDAPTLQPWDLSKYVASPGYSPQNPDNHGGAVYGEKMWLVGAASDSMSELLGEHDPCCGSSSESGGCGKCVLMRVTDSINAEWTALVMRKNRCPPWSNGCEAGKLHFDMAVPGYDNLQFSTANVCGLRGNTGFQSQQASAVLGDWYKHYQNTAAAGASLCSTLPPQFQEGCELFSSWGWRRGDPNAEYRVVDCPEAFKAHVAAQFDANGVVSSF